MVCDVLGHVCVFYKEKKKKKVLPNKKFPQESIKPDLWWITSMEKVKTSHRKSMVQLHMHAIISLAK